MPRSREKLLYSKILPTFLVFPPYTLRKRKLKSITQNESINKTLTLKYIRMFNSTKAGAVSASLII